MTAKAVSRHTNLNPDRFITAGLSLLLAFMPAAGMARRSDRQQPLRYVARYTEAFDAPNTVSTLKGNVKITQGTLVLTGTMAKIHLDSHSQIARVVVTGTPAHIQQQDDKNQLMSGDADILDYDTTGRIAVLTGHAKVRQSHRVQFSGHTLTYNGQTGLITGQSGYRGLVHGVFLPRPPSPDQPSSGKPEDASGQPSATAPRPNRVMSLPSHPR